MCISRRGFENHAFFLRKLLTKKERIIPPEHGMPGDSDHSNVSHIHIVVNESFCRVLGYFMGILIMSFKARCLTRRVAPSCLVPSQGVGGSSTSLFFCVGPQHVQAMIAAMICTMTMVQTDPGQPQCSNAMPATRVPTAPPA